VRSRRVRQLVANAALCAVAIVGTRFRGNVVLALVPNPKLVAWRTRAGRVASSLQPLASLRALAIVGTRFRGNVVLAPMPNPSGSHDGERQLVAAASFAARALAIVGTRFRGNVAGAERGSSRLRENVRSSENLRNAR